MTSIVVDPETLDSMTPDAPANTADKAPEPTPEPQNELPEDDLPEKYRGKSIKDLIDMHRNAESELGRSRNEVGMVRKLADELIGVRAMEQRLRENPAPKPDPITADRLFSNPEETIVSVAKREADARAADLEKRTADLEAELMVERFEKKHPGFQQTMQTPEFGSFVQGSDYRRGLAIKASQGDFSAADELFGLYEDVSSVKGQQVAPQERASGDVAAARKASLAKSGGSSAAGVVPSTNGSKVWSRAELMELRIRNPDKFDMMQDEILAAYREKRVR